jgi:hypothetical protein
MIAVLQAERGSDIFRRLRFVGARNSDWRWQNLDLSILVEQYVSFFSGG